MDECDLMLINGEIKTGICKLVGNKVIYKVNKNQKREVFTSKNLFGLFIYYELATVEYYYMNTNKKNKIKLLELVVEGDVSLYVDYRYIITASNNVGSNSIISNNYYYKNKTSLYLSRNKSSDVVLIKEQNKIVYKSIKKFIVNYFKNCPVLVDKINNREFEEEEIIKIVEYYNTYCNL